jgi:hypothetical protein
MTNRDYLAYACIVAGIFWIAFYLFGGSDGLFGTLSLVLAAGNALVVASIYEFIKPWRRQITNLALADFIGVVLIVVGVGGYVSKKLTHEGVSAFTIHELGLGALLLALIAVLGTKAWLTWMYSRELKAAGVAQEAGKLPPTLQIVSGALLALFAGGCTMMIGGFGDALNPVVILFGWLPLFGGLLVMTIGVRKLGQA